jgi:hypothetical protein
MSVAMRNPELIRVTRGDWCVYLHEASHGVVAIACGFAVDYIERRDRPDYEGTRGGTHSRGRIHWGSCELQTQEVWHHCVCLLAGGEGERAHFGRVESGGDGGDIEQAREMLAQLLQLLPSDPQLDTFLQMAREEAAADVAANWDWIVSVALALRRHRLLTGEQILQLRPVSPTNSSERGVDPPEQREQS